MLEIINGYKKYKNLEVLNDINLKFEDGKMYAIIGANGSGKSLILKLYQATISLQVGKYFKMEIKLEKITII